MLELGFSLFALPLLTALQRLCHVRAINDAIASEHLAPLLPAHDFAGDSFPHSCRSLRSGCCAPCIVNHIALRLARLYARILAEPLPCMAHILHWEERLIGFAAADDSL